MAQEMVREMALAMVYVLEPGDGVDRDHRVVVRGRLVVVGSFLVHNAPRPERP